MADIKLLINGPNFSYDIVKPGPVFFNPYRSDAVGKILHFAPIKAIEEIDKAGLKERGGRTFSVAGKLKKCSLEESKVKYIICNADEGDPGIFKDHVLLKESPEMIFHGMICAGYACGAENGIFYLREEYDNLQPSLEDVLIKLRQTNFLGKNIAGRKDFNFDISIKRSVGAYISGAESALTGAYEGRRDDSSGEIFLAEKGFLGNPAVVHTVETLVNIAGIFSNSASWFAGLGNGNSSGTRIVQVEGDCLNPGIYELEWGASINDIISMASGEDIYSVLAGGPSGLILNRDSFSRKLCFEDLSVGGSLILSDKHTSVLDIVHDCMDFFTNESCGWCVPCRCGNVLLKNKLLKIIKGSGNKRDMKELLDWCLIVQKSSRCGLGQTAPNIILSSFSEFINDYNSRFLDIEYTTEFDLEKALVEAKALRYGN